MPKTPETDKHGRDPRDQFEDAIALLFALALGFGLIWWLLPWWVLCLAVGVWATMMDKLHLWPDE